MRRHFHKTSVRTIETEDQLPRRTFTMSDIPTEQTMLRFDHLLKDMKLEVGDNSSIKREAAIVRAYYQDRATVGVEEAIRKWNPRYDEFYGARITLERITAAATALKGVPRLRKLLEDVLVGSLAHDFQPSPSKDKFYELELAATLRLAGFSVALREPDVVASGNGLTKPLAIACKYPSSRQQVHDHISCGYHQITKQNLDGVVSIGLELMVAKELKLPAKLDFRRANTPALVIMERRLDTELRKLQTEREKDYPEERKLDGLMLTLSFSGIDGDPPMLANLNSIALGCRPGNPLMADLTIIKQKIEAINP
jgi:hypothetical protein